MKKILLILLILFSFTLFAQNKKVEEENKNVEIVNEEDIKLNINNDQNAGLTEISRTSSIKQVLGLLFSVALIIALIFLFFRFLKNVSKPKDLSRGFIKLITSETLFGNRYVHIIKAGSNFYLLGSSDDSVNLLEKITDKELIDELQLYESRVPELSETFMDKFQSALSGFKTTISMEDKIKEFKSSTKKHKDKLKKM